MATNFSQSGITTVFLDIDDTLWWFSHNSPLALRHVTQLLGVDRMVPYDDFERLYLQVNGQLWERYHHGTIGKRQLLTERFSLPLTSLGVSQADALRLADVLNDEYLTYLSQLPTLVPGARHLLEHLAARGYRLCTLSNGFSGLQQRKLHYSGIEHFISLNVLSDDCGITKPMPGIFSYALERCGATADQVVMIGDNPDADIAGAHHAGWRTIYFNCKHLPIAPGLADATVATLPEVERLL